MEGPSMEAAMHAVEQACLALQVPSSRVAAEATLLEFRRSPQSIPPSQYILEHSQLATARFQAAATLQEAALRDWVFFTAEEKSSLVMYCLHYVMARAASAEAYVQKKVAAVAAVLMKRGWLDTVATEKEAFFHEMIEEGKKILVLLNPDNFLSNIVTRLLVKKVKQAVVGAHGSAAQKAGIAFLESLVSEFSPTTASAMGLSAEFHEHCRNALELDYLQKFYEWAQGAALNVAERIFQSLGEQLEVDVCASALRLMSQILSWEFQGTLTRGPNGVVICQQNRSTAVSSFREKIPMKRSGDYGTLVQPGQAWQDLLLAPNNIKWILELYACFGKYASNDFSWVDSPLAVSARQLIVQLCSLSGTVFPADGASAQELHMQRLLLGVASWLSPPQIVISAIRSGKSESELLDGCRALLSVASQTSPAVFDQLLKPSLSTIALLASLTEAMIRAHREVVDGDDPWLNEALDILLDTWTVLLQPTDLSRKIPFPSFGIEATASVFKAYVDTELKAASTLAEDEDDETENVPASVAARDDRLSAFALLARAAPEVAMPVLATLMSERCKFLQEYRGVNVPVSVLEELHWILLMSGHVLADSVEGETPMIPESILSMPSTSEDPMNHPALVLSNSAVVLAHLSLDAGLREKAFSSRLMEAIVWFFARWVDTYLMPVDGGRGPSTTPSGHDGNVEIATHQQIMSDGRIALHTAFGEQGKGKDILHLIVRVALLSLTAWPGETALQELTCYSLLPALVRRRNICSHLLNMEAWQELAKAFAFQNQSLLALAGPIQRAMAETLCRSACGMESTERTNQFVKDLMGPIAGNLSDLSKRHDLRSFSQKPDAIFHVICLFERLRGAARATVPRSQKSIFEMGASVMEPLLVFLEIYKNQTGVVYVLFKYVVDWVDGQVSFLERNETAVLFNFCLRLLQIYSQHNIGRISLSTSKNLLDESQAEQYKDLRALLQLLINLSSKDLIDFASDGEGELDDSDVAQVIYLGLHIINPLISVELLKYPKLCRQFFTLLVHMLEVYPEKIAKLSDEGFNRIVTCLEFGLKHQDVEIVNMTLMAINAIAFYHYQCVCRGQEGLESHAANNVESQDSGILAHFLQMLLQFILFDDYSTDLIDSAADALFPLILCKPPLYQSMVVKLVSAQNNAALQSRLATAFHSLLNSNQLTSSLDRINRRKFRENLYSLLLDVRGFLKTR